MLWTFYVLGIFFLVKIVFLNVIFAIIVDEFVAIRERRAVAQEKMESQCFVCSIPREEFLSNAKGTYQTNKTSAFLVYDLLPSTLEDHRAVRAIPNSHCWSCTHPVALDFTTHLRSEHNYIHYLYFFAYLREKLKRLAAKNGQVDEHRFFTDIESEIIEKVPFPSLLIGQPARTTSAPCRNPTTSSWLEIVLLFVWIDDRYSTLSLDSMQRRSRMFSKPKSNCF